MTANIAPTAVVDPAAKIGNNVSIGHFCVIGPNAEIGDDTTLENHVTVIGHSKIGQRNHLFQNVVIGAQPQDVSYQGTDTRVEIGDDNIFREHCTVHRATEKEDGLTRIGHNCMFMCNTHIAHDCKLSDRIVIANNTMLAGHVHVQNDATISAGIGVHHFVSIGCFSFVGAMSRILQDVPPYMLVEGTPAKVRCANIVALRRNEYPAEDVRLVTEAYKLLYRSRVGAAAAKELLLAGGPMRPVLKHLFDFLEVSHSGRHGRGRDQRRKAA
ncbi:MAG: acyl-ACP--UDP-N-acetylglucosamine O-acyltransferase [Planctomycetota bacterium]